MTTTQNRNREIATQIIAQIPIRLRVAVGFRKAHVIHRGVRCLVTGTRPVTLEIVLDEGNDLYDMYAYTERRNRKTGCTDRTMRYFVEGICAEQMVQTLDLIDRGEIML